MEDAKVPMMTRAEAWSFWRVAEMRGMSWQEWQREQPVAFAAWCSTVPDDDRDPDGDFIR